MLCKCMIEYVYEILLTQWRASHHTDSSGSLHTRCTCTFIGIPSCQGHKSDQKADHFLRRVPGEVVWNPCVVAEEGSLWFTQLSTFKFKLAQYYSPITVKMRKVRDASIST
jgi:hypothetical protein